VPIKDHIEVAVERKKDLDSSDLEVFDQICDNIDQLVDFGDLDAPASPTGPESDSRCQTVQAPNRPIDEATGPSDHHPTRPEPASPPVKPPTGKVQLRLVKGAKDTDPAKQAAAKQAAAKQAAAKQAAAKQAAARQAAAKQAAAKQAAAKQAAAKQAAAKQAAARQAAAKQAAARQAAAKQAAARQAAAKQAAAKQAAARQAAAKQAAAKQAAARQAAAKQAAAKQAAARQAAAKQAAAKQAAAKQAAAKQAAAKQAAAKQAAAKQAAAKQAAAKQAAAKQAAAKQAAAKQAAAKQAAARQAAAKDKGRAPEPAAAAVQRRSSRQGAPSTVSTPRGRRSDDPFAALIAADTTPGIESLLAPLLETPSQAPDIRSSANALNTQAANAPIGPGSAIDREAAVSLDLLDIAAPVGKDAESLSLLGISTSSPGETAFAPLVSGNDGGITARDPIKPGIAPIPSDAQSHKASQTVVAPIKAIPPIAPAAETSRVPLTPLRQQGPVALVSASAPRRYWGMLKSITIGFMVLLLLAAGIWGGFSYMEGFSIAPPELASDGSEAGVDNSQLVRMTISSTTPVVAPPDPGEILEMEVAAFLTSWKTAWEQTAGPDGDLDTYLSYFSEAFEPNGKSKVRWYTDKKFKNRRKKWIAIQIDGIQIEARPAADLVTVRFNQAYSSSNYSDRTVQRVQLRKEGGLWKILALLPAAPKGA
jgi:hypothetical protein